MCPPMEWATGKTTTTPPPRTPTAPPARATASARRPPTPPPIRPSPHPRHPGRHTDHHLRLHQRYAPVHFADEVAKHRLSGQIVRDDAVPHGADYLNGAGSAAQHLLRRAPDGDDSVVPLGHPYHRRLGDDDPLAFYVEQDVGGVHVYRDALA